MSPDVGVILLLLDFAYACPEPISRTSDALGLLFKLCPKTCLKVLRTSQKPTPGAMTGTIELLRYVRRWGFAEFAVDCKLAMTFRKRCFDRTFS